MPPLPLALVTVPDHPFYLWQALAHHVWMREHEFPTRYLFYCGRGGPSRQLSAFMAGAGARVTVWNDWRTNPQYNPSMKPGLVGRFLEANPDVAGAPLVVMDPDAIPLPGFISRAPHMQPTPTRWFGTDTDSYTGPAYLKSKGEDLWVELCKLVGVDPDHAGQFLGRGSQWLFRAGDGGLWLEIQRLSEQAYPVLTGHRSDVQVWCAEMYVTQLVLARENIAATARAPMRMAWATGAREDWQKAGFFHNAGVTEAGTGHFHKGQWQARPPFFLEDDAEYGATEESATFRYVELLKSTQEQFPQLVKEIAA